MIIDNTEIFDLGLCARSVRGLYINRVITYNIKENKIRDTVALLVSKMPFAADLGVQLLLSLGL
jgi:hypothetical protein